MPTHNSQHPCAAAILRVALLAGTAAVAGLAPAAGAHGATTTLATEYAPTRVAAWESTVMWSKLDQATGRYQLVKSVDGSAPVPVGVPQRAGRPFDVDVGTDRSGATFAVYTRRGDIYALNVATGSERKIAKLSAPNVDERSPTIQRGRIAFIRRSRGADELRIGNMTGPASGSRVLTRSSSIVHAELGDRHVAYGTSMSVPAIGGGEGRLRIRNLSTGADKVVYRARSGGANIASITRASYVAEPEGFLWARTNMGSGGGNRLVRYTLRDSKLGYAPGSMQHISTAWAGAKLGAVTTSVLGGSESAHSTSPGACRDNTGVEYCTVQLSGPLTFTQKP